MSKHPISSVMNQIHKLFEYAHVSVIVVTLVQVIMKQLVSLSLLPLFLYFSSRNCFRIRLLCILILIFLMK
ncbi:unnamed protein product [Onchocerca flexuosa]|uniref:Uncharacterized protein n=1 Tax=Onchocerca flexuosa TaxID=387005 RepID=A0A183HE04_9BILA|nr:unnamed protein product [Onchocerca flexuosa]